MGTHGSSSNKKIKSVDKLCSIMFWAKLRINDKVPDLSLLPPCRLFPCSSSLKKHTSRAHYVAKIWRKAELPLQDIGSFQHNGWLPDGSIDWIQDPFPEELGSLFVEKSEPEYDVYEGEDNENLEEEDDDDCDNNI